MKVITKIEVQKKNSKRCSIYINEEFAFGMDIDAIGIYNIQKGNSYSEEEYRNLLNNLQYEKAKYVALKYIGYSPRTKQQVIKKLQSSEYDEFIIEKTISFLLKYKYIDDTEYVRNYIPNRIKQKRQGRKRIIYDLAQKGIDRCIIEPILEEYEENEYESALYLYNKRVKGKTPLEQKEKEKIYRYLQGRGYTYDTINSVIQSNSTPYL